MHQKHNERQNAVPIQKSIGLLLLALILIAGSLAVPRKALADEPDGNLIDNWSMEDYEDPYDIYERDDEEYDLSVADSWRRFSETSSGSRQVYFMADENYADCFDVDQRHTEGDSAQNFWSTYGFNAGIYQKSIGVTSGRAYGVKAALYAAIGSNAPSNATIIKRVGIDPTGGSDPDSSSVVWGEADETTKANDDDWNDVRAAVLATSSKMTVFISATNVTDIAANKRYALWVDAVVAERAPVCTASSPSLSTSSSFTVTASKVSNPPDGKFLYYDVDYKDGIDGDWTRWRSKKTSAAAVFVGEPGHTYYFRARAWADYDGVKLYGPFTTASNGDSSTIIGGVVSGKVDRLDGWRYSSAHVSLASTAITTTSDADGNYTLPIPGTGSYSVTVSAPGTSYFTSPPPVGINVTSTTVAWGIPLTLRMAGPDPVANGDFETALSDGWETSSTDGNAPVVETDTVRSGGQTLALRRGAASIGQSEIRQTLSLSAMWDPLLSFYVSMPVTHTGDTLQAGILDGATCTPWLTTTATSGWTHYWLRLTSGKRASYTGSLGICFRANQATAAPMEAYLDEVSVAKGFSGPLDTFLPLLTRNN